VRTSEAADKGTVLCHFAIAGKEDPFEFDANLQLHSVMGGVAQVGDLRLQGAPAPARGVTLSESSRGSWRPTVKYHYY